MAGERSAIIAFFREIDQGRLVALRPNPERYDQDEGHDEARELAHARGISNPDWVFWHRQAAWVFDSAGDLTAGLRLNWGGDHDRVLAALRGIPAPFRIVDHGQGAVFEIVSDALAERNAEPLPDPTDTPAVKDRIRRITASVERRKPDSWSEGERRWLAAVMRHGDLAARAYAVRWAVQIPDLDDETFEALMVDWTRIYAKAPKDVLVWTFLDALAAREDPRIEDVLDECERRKSWTFRAGAGHFLERRASPLDVGRLYRLAQFPGATAKLPGNSPALRGWVKVRSVMEARSTEDIATEALSDPVFDDGARHELTRIAEHGVR